MTFRQAQNHALNTAGIQTAKELIEWLRSNEKPLNFPVEPQNFYEEWTNATDFLKIQKSNKMTYSQSKKYIQSFQFKTKIKAMKWLASGDRPEELPVSPPTFYRKEWEEWGYLPWT